MRHKFLKNAQKLLLETKQKEEYTFFFFFSKMICSIAFYYRPFNLLFPLVTEDKSKTDRYFKVWSVLHLKFEPPIKIIGLKPTIVAIPRCVKIQLC